MLKIVRFVIASVLVAAVTAASYAFASSSTQPGSGAGEGSAGISGWVVSDVAYHLGSDPSKLEAVSFRLDRPAGTVLVRLRSIDSEFHACANTGGNRWQCDIAPALEITALDELRVIAIDN